MTAEEKIFTLPYTLILTKPVSLTETVTLTELVFQNELTAGMLENMPATDIRARDFFPLIAGMTGQTVHAIRKLAFRDYNAAMEVVNSFL